MNFQFLDRQLARPKLEESPGRLSRCEWQIMTFCWRLGRANVRQVLREDRKAQTRDYRTILTFARRIATKGWLEVEKEGNTNYYSPAISQGDGLTIEIGRIPSGIITPKP